MKKLILASMMVVLLGAAASAQTTAPAKKSTTTSDTKTKVKPTSTVPQKVHNVIHPKHKKYSGVKAKQKTEK